MSKSCQNIFFDQEVEQRTHSIVGAQPLEGYLVPQLIPKTESHNPYNQQVQYFGVEAPRQRVQKHHKEIQDAGVLLLEKDLNIDWEGPAVELIVEVDRVMFWLGLNEAQAVIELSAFAVKQDTLSLQKMELERAKVVAGKCVESIISHAVLFQFTGIRIVAVLVSMSALRLLIQAKSSYLLIDLINPPTDSSSSDLMATIANVLLQKTQNAWTEGEKPRIQACKVEKLVGWQAVQERYCSLSWQCRVVLIYGAFVDWGLSVGQGRFSKWKRELYLRDICETIKEIISQSTLGQHPQIESYIQGIANEQGQLNVFELFEQLSKTLAGRRPLKSEQELNLE